MITGTSVATNDATELLIESRSADSGTAKLIFSMMVPRPVNLYAGA